MFTCSFCSPCDFSLGLKLFPNTEFQGEKKCGSSFCTDIIPSSFHVRRERYITFYVKQTHSTCGRYRRIGGLYIFGASLKRGLDYLQLLPQGEWPRGEWEAAFPRLPFCILNSVPQVSIPSLERLEQNHSICSVPPGLPGGGSCTGAGTHRENGLSDAGIPLVLPQDGPCERAGEVHSGHCKVG